VTQVWTNEKGWVDVNEAAKEGDQYFERPSMVVMGSPRSGMSGWDPEALRKRVTHDESTIGPFRFISTEVSWIDSEGVTVWSDFNNEIRYGYDPQMDDTPIYKALRRELGVFPEWV
jgi:hypothetical protein